MRTLIVCEKPDAAARVARALDDDGDPRRIETRGVPLYESRRRSETIFVCSALGHLYAVSGKSGAGRRYYPVWDYGWKPKHLVDKQSARLARWIQTINAISKKTDRFVNACVSPDTRILTNAGHIPIAELEGTWPEQRVVTFTGLSASPKEHKLIRYHRLEPKLYGIPCFELRTVTGRYIRATADHQFRSRKGWLKMANLQPGDQVAVYPASPFGLTHDKHQDLLTVEDVWATLNSLRSKQSRQPHSKYRYDSRQYMDVCHLRGEGVSYPEIATRTGLSLRTVRRWLGEGKQPYTVRNPAIEKLQALRLAPLFMDDERILPIARLLGATFGDGCLSQSSNRWYSVCFVAVCERSGGADEVARDLETLGFRYSRNLVKRAGRINGRLFLQQTEQVRCTSLALWLLLRALGAPVGSKTDKAFQIPPWITGAPKKVRYEFLSTYLGGEMSVARWSRAHPRSFSACEVRFNKREDLEENGKQFAIQLASLLAGFGVTTTRIQLSPSNVQRLDGLKSVSVRVRFSNANKSLENLLRNVPVQYCLRKRIRGDLVADYTRLKARIGSRRIIPFVDWAKSAKAELDNSLLLWDQVETIVPVDCNDVRDLTVNSAHTYIANGFLTHNCDFDVEGSLIGYTVLRYACDRAHEKAERMKFSTMTERELQNAYRAVSPELDFSQADAGRCRHELDWLYGINLTRLLTEASLKQNMGYLTLSTGRVQGPTLKFVVDREEEVQCFTPTPYWTIDATISHDGDSYQLEYEKEKILVQAHALRIVTDCTNALLSVVDEESRSIHQSSPFPFDLSTLQGEAYRHFGFSPSRTLALAERLYLDAVISYPRTSSQKLPPDIGYAEILRGIAHSHQYGRLANKLANRKSLRPNNGPKSDPAHPAIYPTGEAPKRSLIQPETNLLDLIIRRFMATFAEPSLREATRITLAKEPHKFFLNGSRLLTEGWVEYYRPYLIDESKELPNLEKGDQAKVQRIEAAEKFTDPPPRYNPSSLLRKMEDGNIGTKATRAEIIEILYRRGYIKETRMEATPLAVKVISILDKYCPLITDIGFTARLESQMEKIQSGQATRLGILTEALEHLRPVILDLISKENELGVQLSEVIVSQRLSDTTFTTPCPSCNSILKVIRSRASGKRFIGCEGYRQGCRFTLPLPQFGTISLTRNKCKTCGFQLVSVKSKARRPQTSCPRCYTNRMKERATTHSSYAGTSSRPEIPST